MMNKAIVTAIIGDRHRQLWQTTARASWEQYARKHGYALIVIEQPIDQGPLASQRSLAWQKLLVLSLPEIQRYDRVVWLDGDILINHETAPCVVSNVPPERIGAVRDQPLLSHPSLAVPFARNNKWQGSPADLARRRYQLNGLEPAFDYYLNTGVLVLSPRHHRDALESVYQRHRETEFSYSEQLGLSHEILSRGLHHAIDPRFNTLWLEYKVAFYPFLLAAPSLLPLCLATAMSNNFFLHFAGWHTDMSKWNPGVQITDKIIGIPLDVVEQIKDAWEMMAQKIRQSGPGEST
jgi:hypothetical protein